MNWIRVANGIQSDPSVGALGRAIGADRLTAIGHIVCVLLQLPVHAKDGNLSAVDDEDLEIWALWRGKRGRFAKAFREQLCAEGRVRSWEKHNGAAIRESDAARERMRKGRQTKRENEENESGTFGEQSGEHSGLRDVTVRNGTLRSPQTESPEVEENGPPPPDVLAAYRQCAPNVAEVAHPALLVLLRSVPDATGWGAIIRGMGTGQSGPNGRSVSPGRLSAAVLDFVASGKYRRASTNLFRGFVQRAKEPEQSTNYVDPDVDKCDELRTIRAQNEKRLAQKRELLPEPSWAAELDARYPDGRTRPQRGAA